MGNEKLDAMAARLQQQMSPAPIPAPKERKAEPKVQPVVDAPVTGAVVAPRRGRPIGSRTRKEEVRHVGFEAEVSLLMAFDEKVARCGMMRREAFEAALRCFVEK